MVRGCFDCSRAGCDWSIVMSAPAARAGASLPCDCTDSRRPGSGVAGDLSASDGMTVAIMGCPGSSGTVSMNFRPHTVHAGA
jgi:hypothetical protein